MNKKHLIAVFALVIALVLPISLIAITLASDTVVETAESALSYEGVAAKAVKQPGVRSLWYVDNAAVEALEQKGYTVYYGSLMGAKRQTTPPRTAKASGSPTIPKPKASRLQAASKTPPQSRSTARATRARPRRST